MERSSVRALVAISALLVIAACSSSNEDAGGAGRVPPVDLTLKVTDAPPTGALAGTVVDENGAPIVGAAVAAGSTTTTTDASGAFSLAPAPGRVLLNVTAPGKVVLTRSIGVTSQSPALRLKLATAGSVQMVAATGGPIATGGVTLDIPAGAYPSGGTVAATWIDRAHVSAASGRALFIDQDGTRHRFVGQLDVQASAQPASPVTVHVPVPAGTPSQATLVMYAVDGGEVGQRVMASNVANGIATFTVPHFSSWAVYLAVAAAEVALAVVVSAWMVLDVIDAGAQAVDARLEPGQDLPSDSEVSDAVVVAPNGAQVYLDAHVSRIHTDDDGTTSSTCIELCNVQADVPPTPAAPPGKTKYQIRTKTAALGCRGTVFSVRQKPCSTADGSAIDTVEVSEGDVDFNLGGVDYDVPAGKQAEGCEGCKDPKQAVCDCDVKACGAAGGMCDPCLGQPGYRAQELPSPSFLPIGGVPRCVEEGSVCCTSPLTAATPSSICRPSTTVIHSVTCQCAGTPLAGCASTNSACGPNGVVDCGGGGFALGALLCEGDARNQYSPGARPGDGYHCLNPLGDNVQGSGTECGACGNICPNKEPGGPSECKAGACVLK